jgi:hypothetical protein
MTTPHEPGTPRYPEDSDQMETRLIEEITQIQAQLGPDLLGPSSSISLRTATTEALGRQADRFETLAVLYRRLAVRRGALHGLRERHRQTQAVRFIVPV